MVTQIILVLLLLSSCHFWTNLFQQEMEKCEVKDLSHETIENLTHSLEKPTLNWEELMRSKTFGSIYSANDIYKIGMSGSHRATVLIQDLVSREISLQVLLNGLKEIGNRKAISIIERGR